MTPAVKPREPSIGLVTVVTSCAFALIQLDVTIVNVALPQIGAELGAGISVLQWVVDAYALTFAVLLLSAGLLSDRLGARIVYRVGLTVFAVASLGCGIAPGQGLLVAGRIVQGVGAAAMLPSSLAILNRACGHDASLRARAVGWWTAAGSIAIAAGPILAGLLLAFTSWRSIFLINLPICAAGLALTVRLPGTGRKESGDRGFDLAGQALAVLALAGLIGGTIEARPLGVAHPGVIACLLVAVLASAAFVIVERRGASPMLPLGLLRNRGFSTAIAFGIIVNFTYYGVMFVLTLYLQRVRGYSALTAGAAYFPLTATLFAVNVLSGWLVGRIGSRWPMVAGATVDAVGFALLLLLDGSSRYALMLPAFILIPAGMGLGVPAMTDTVLASVERAAAGVASATLNAARQAAGAVGVAVFGALAGERSRDVVGGLHVAAMLSIALLGTAALLCLAGIKRREGGTTRGA